jgi:hypothetical protein
MLEAFAEFAATDPVYSTIMHSVVGCAPGTRLYRIIRLPYGWRLWLATRDFIHGSYLELHDNGRVVRFETRPDEGDELFVVRPSDEEIRHGHNTKATRNARGGKEEA